MGQVTIQGTVFDIYGVDSEADTYMTARWGGSAWSDAEVDERKQTLVSATRMIDRENWLGQKTVSAQALEFPRTGLTDKDGNSVDSATVPLVVEEANYELAFALLNDAAVQEADTTGSNVRRVKAGSAEVQFFRPTAGTPFPTIANDLLRAFRDSGALAGLASGTDEVSTFCDPNPHGLTEGYP